MRNAMLPILRSASVLFLLALATPNTATSQELSPDHCKECKNTTPFDNTDGLQVTIVIKESFAVAGVDAVVRQLPGTSGSTVVGLRRAAITPELVYDALVSIASVRTKHHGPPPAVAATRLMASSHRRPVPSADRAWIADIVSQLASATPMTVTGVGTVPAINIVIDSKKAHKAKG